VRGTRSLLFAALALAALSSAPAKAGSSELDQFLKEEDVLDKPAAKPKAPAPARTWEQFLLFVLREGRPGILPAPVAPLLGFGPTETAKVLRYELKPKGGGSIERAFFLLISLDPATGEANPREAAFYRRRVFPKGRTEWEERACLRVSLEKTISRASYAYGRILMAEDKPLDPESTRAAALRDEELKFYLSESLRLRPVQDAAPAERKQAGRNLR
jgi:hypothetical protein